MAGNELFPRSASTLMEVSKKKLDLSEYYADIAPRMGGKLLAFRESILENRTDHWLEYVPECYRPGTPVPLVISIHGGGQTDYGQFYETSWYRVAERTGAVIVCPEIPQSSPERLGDGPAPSGDIIFLDRLLDLTRAKYSIDPGRIFMQGMSMGDLFSTQYGRLFGHKLAGIGMTSGPTAPSKLFDGEKLLYNDGPAAVWQSGGAFDSLVIEPGHNRSDINIANRRFWMTLNRCAELPRLRLAYNENWVYYPGEKAPLVYRDYSNHGHNQSSDDAECAWDSLFSRVRRDGNGSIILLEELPEGDRSAVVLLEGSSSAYVDNKKVPVGAPVFSEKDYSIAARSAPRVCGNRAESGSRYDGYLYLCPGVVP